jgi:hypothetical protein
MAFALFDEFLGGTRSWYRRPPGGKQPSAEGEGSRQQSPKWHVVVSHDQTICAG